MGLSDTKIRNAKPRQNQYKLYDRDGLFIIVTPSGGKWWRFKYRIGPKEKLLSLGTYPTVGLAKARIRRDKAREQVADGIDPSRVRKATKAASVNSENTFEVIAREWFSKFEPGWAPGHSIKILGRLENDVYPYIGDRPILEITPPELLRVLHRIESRGALDSAHRTRNTCSQIFRYAVATGRADRDPAADLRGALPPARGKHFAAITDPEEAAGLLRAIDGYKGSFVTICALRLAPLVFVRPGELRHAEWAEIDLEKAEWNIPAKKMKLKHPHLVPLSRQAVDIIKEIQPLTGAGRYVFPSVRTNSRPMSDNTVLAALRRMGYTNEEMTGHGFRAMARTILDEVLNVRADFIEHQLAHEVKDPNGRAYNRTAFLSERRKMMQTWADYLDGLRAGAKVVPLRKAASD
jgi:integrase